ncbi:MAG: MauE/DoxX family redox-associated membrane protein [Lysobacteraceae bacterium]
MSGLDALAEVCRWYVLLALLAAAVGKSRDIAAFRYSLTRAMPALARIEGPLAWGIVLAEAAIALALLAGGATGRIGMIAALAMFVVFTAVIGTSIVRGRAIVCNCFGTSTHRVGGLDVARNLALIAAAALVVVHGAAPVSWPAGLVLAGLAAIAVAVSIRLRELAWLLHAKPTT